MSSVYCQNCKYFREGTSSMWSPILPNSWEACKSPAAEYVEVKQGINHRGPWKFTEKKRHFPYEMNKDNRCQHFKQRWGW